MWDIVKHNLNLKLGTKMKEMNQNQNAKMKHLEEKENNIQERSNTFWKGLENLTNQFTEKVLVTFCTQTKIGLKIWH
jgi:hypothetical protein